MQTWTNFSLGNGAAVTTWSNNAFRGWLDSKRYADTSGPDYTYTAGGRLKTRQWARLGQGKGAQDRVVPIGSMAVTALECYLSQGRPTLLGESQTDRVLFPIGATPWTLTRWAPW